MIDIDRPLIRANVSRPPLRGVEPARSHSGLPTAVQLIRRGAIGNRALSAFLSQRAASPRARPATDGARSGHQRRLSRAPLAGNIVTDAAHLIAGEALSWSTWLRGSNHYLAYNKPVWGPLLSSGGFGTGMYAILQGTPGKGALKGTATNGKGNNPAWKALAKKKTSSNGAFYVQAHLLNERLGGPGSGRDKWKNLVPLTNRGNAASALSMYNTVERAVINEVGNGRTVGYRVIPIYTQLPYGHTRLIVNQALGVLGWTPWLTELANLLYWETFVPSELWTSWWYHENSWNPLPSIRRITNFATMNDIWNFKIFTAGAARVLTPQELTLLTIGEGLKAALAAGSWYFGGPANATMWTLLGRLASAVGVDFLAGSSIAWATAQLQSICSAFPWWATLVEGVGPAQLILDRYATKKTPNRPPLRDAVSEYGGFIPSASSLAVTGALAYRWLTGH